MSTEFGYSGACSAQSGQFLWMYGGRDDTSASTQLWRYYIFQDTLTPIPATNNSIFPPSEGATCAIYNNVFYVFGGGCTNTTYSVDITSYTDYQISTSHLSPVTWKSLSTTILPPSTNGASGVVIEKKFYMWGGLCTETSHPDFWVFDLDKKDWTVVTTFGEGPGTRRFPVFVHDSVAPQPQIILFGGDQDNIPLNDLWVYNVTQKRWFQPNISAEAVPSPRRMSNYIFLEGMLLIFSGEGNTSEPLFRDFWQIFFPRDCFHYQTCATCTSSSGCGWCSSNPEGYRCLSGHNVTPYIEGECVSGGNIGVFSTNIGVCPIGVCPSWVIALIVVICSFGLFVAWHFLEKWEDNLEMRIIQQDDDEEDDVVSESIN
eukprot:TRINITY_DN5434_c0_g1_i4.p1 TRINITY_DN5434_c0_g1~~TRINITY_DN5434_c0_g1_i4.p1  ORF type:complete len:373 (-),score=91.01 TRINITY_DN5434_c0_g1_i4:288-1406(-)